MNDDHSIPEFLQDFPEGFESKPPEYQIAWLRRKIPEVRQQLAAIEEEHSRTEKTALGRDRELKQYLEDQNKMRPTGSRWKRFFGLEPEPKGPGLFDAFMDLADAATLTVTGVSLEATRNYL